MLSKIDYFLHPAEKRKQLTCTNKSNIISTLKKFYPQYDIRGISGDAGTLGIFYTVVSQDQQIFYIKTHQPEVYCRKRLEIESKLFKICSYRAYVDYFCDDEYCFLVMHTMQGLNKLPDILSIQQLCNSIKYITNKEDLDNLGLPTISIHLNIAEQAIDILGNMDELPGDICQCLSDDLRDLSTFLENHPRILCHGDLSNKNILLFNNKLILIDFEDAFWGYEDYDFLYWLTFFEQRRFYKKNFLETLPISIPVKYAKITMELIVLLKCYLSYLNGSIKSNSVSSSDRISEILQL